MGAVLQDEEGNHHLRHSGLAGRKASACEIVPILS
jgi:hypothetical protein